MDGGTIIKRARVIRGYTQEELAGQYGCSTSTLQNWENERTPIPFKDVTGILKHLHFKLEDMLDAA